MYTLEKNKSQCQNIQIAKKFQGTTRFPFTFYLKRENNQTAKIKHVHRCFIFK